jgi:tetratricopeptide (TPR) repeat protein
MNADELIVQAQELSLQGEYDRAIAAYTDALRMAPSEAAGYYGRGYCYYARQDAERAATDFVEGMRLDPALLDSYATVVSKNYCNRAEAWQQQKEWNRAILDYTEAIRVQPKTEAFYGYNWYLRGGCYLSKGDFDSAIADFDEAIRLGYTGYNDAVLHSRALAVAIKEAKH